MTPTQLEVILAEREACAEVAGKLVRFDRKGADAQQRARADAFQSGQRYAAEQIRNRPTPASEEGEGAETAFGISKRRHEARMADLATPSETRIAKLEAAIEAALSELNTPGHFGGTGAVGGTNGIAMRLRNTLARP